MSSETKVFKLTTGEWVVSEIADDSLIPSTTSLTLDFPMLCHIVPQGNQGYGLALMPFNPINPNGKFKLNVHSIVGESEPTKDLLDAYRQQRSGIEIVSSLSNVGFGG